MIDADWSEATLDGTRFVSCDLRGANLTNASLQGTRFHGCDLRDAVLPSPNDPSLYNDCLLDATGVSSIPAPPVGPRMGLSYSYTRELAAALASAAPHLDLVVPLAGVDAALAQTWRQLFDHLGQHVVPPQTLQLNLHLGRGHEQRLVAGETPAQCDTRLKTQIQTTLDALAACGPLPRDGVAVRLMDVTRLQPEQRQRAAAWGLELVPAKGITLSAW
jgi:hypothetical protein